MAHITVSIDGVARAAISCDGFDVVAVGVGVGGTRVEQELATVHVSSSRYPVQADSTYLIWVDVALVPGQKLSIAFAESGPIVGDGKTIDELHPEDSDTGAETDFKLTSEMMQELRGKPKVRAGWRFQVRGPNESHHESRTIEAEHGFGFNVLWNTYRPDRASFSLHSYGLDSLEQQTLMRDHIRGRLELGETVELVVAD